VCLGEQVEKKGEEKSHTILEISFVCVLCFQLVPGGEGPEVWPMFDNCMCAGWRDAKVKNKHCEEMEKIV
jgi:hypothetical protein